MTPCMCLVQSGQTPAGKEEALKGLLNAFSEKAFGQQADINWIAVKEGNGFTAAVPSTSSLVSMTADAPLPQERRKALLSELCDLWMEETGCSLNEIVAVISDPQA